MKELDLTQGNVVKVLFQFALPYLLANVLQALYGGADLFVVGQFDDAASVAGVAIGSQVMQTVTGIILGLTTGITVLIGIATGARNYKELVAVIGSSVWLFALIGIVLSSLMVLCHDSITSVMHTPAEAMQDTQAYLLIASLGIPFIIGYNVVCGILRGLGDSRTPLYFVLLACIINIVLDFLLVGAFHLRAAGAALATISSQGISFVTALWFLHRRGFSFPFTRKDIRLNGLLSRRIMVLGAPIALQDALVNISFLIITVIVYQMGVIASAALGVVEKVIVFAMLPPVAISSAVAAMTAQNYDFNSGLWAEIEELEREVASGYDTLYVVTGPVLDADGDGQWKHFQDNAGNSVSVPEAYFRVLLGVKGDEGVYDAVGFFCLNKDDGRTVPDVSDLWTVAQIEEMTGITFFKNLSPELEAEVKSRLNPEVWGF